MNKRLLMTAAGRAAAAATAEDLVLCESADGWSLHAPDATDEDIASGDAPALNWGEHPICEHNYTFALRQLRQRAMADE